MTEYAFCVPIDSATWYVVTALALVGCLACGQYLAAALQYAIKRGWL